MAYCRKTLARYLIETAARGYKLVEETLENGEKFNELHDAVSESMYVMDDILGKEHKVMYELKDKLGRFKKTKGGLVIDPNKVKAWKVIFKVIEDIGLELMRQSLRGEVKTGGENYSRGNKKSPRPDKGEGYGQTAAKTVLDNAAEKPNDSSPHGVGANSTNAG